MNPSAPFQGLADPRLAATAFRPTQDWSQDPMGAYLKSLGLAPSDASNPWTSQLPAAPAPVSPVSTPDSAPAPMPQSIDDYLKSKGSPMAGQGQAIYDAAVANHIDPRLIVALAGAETGFGNNVTRGQNNAFNWSWNIQHPSKSPFDSWEAGISRVANGLSRLYKLDDTSTMYDQYCKGPDCANGLQNLNTFMREQGADPKGLYFVPG